MIKESEYFKIRVTVPSAAAEVVRAAMAESGAGKQGNYSHCSFSVRGVGRFRPEAGADPSIGEVGKDEEVEEEMIETICHRSVLKQTILAIKKAHPYEEPAIDIVARYEVE